MSFVYYLDHPLFASEICVVVLTEVTSACVQTIHSLIIDELRMTRTGLSTHAMHTPYASNVVGEDLIHSWNDFSFNLSLYQRIYVDKDKRKIQE